MHRKMILALVLISMMALGGVAGCRGEEEAPVRDEPATFIALLDVNRDEEVVIDLGLHSGSGPLPADDTFGGRWELREADGALRAAADVHELDSVPGGSEKVVFTWRGKLAPGAYELSWGAPDYGGTVVAFEVVAEEDGSLALGPHQEVSNTTAFPPKR